MAAALPPTRKSKGWIRSHLRLLIALTLLAGGVSAFIAWKLQPAKVVVTPVVRGKAIDAVYATGTVEAENRVNIKAKTSGSIAEILVREGAPVKKGDLIARIDNPTVTFDLKRGQADLSAASAQAGKNAPQIAALRAQADAVTAELTTARQELARSEQLFTGGAIPQSELDRARSRVAQLEGSLAANEAQQRAVRIDLTANAARQAAQVQSLASRVTDTEVRAPLDGIVLTRSVEIGEVITVNQTLFKVGDTSSLILEVSVDEADVARVQKDAAAAVSLYAFPRQTFKGTVFEVFPDANRERKAFLAKVRLASPPAGLRSGMSAEVNIIAAERDGVLLAPTESVADDAVWVVRGGRAERQPVTIGIRDLLRVEIMEGLAEGDEVIVEGADKLKPGSRVEKTLRPADKMAPLPDKTQPPAPIR
ncbi:MAG: efflux RND transporter periplasmic adaptor subunit [Polyangiaceae bacterium]|nr:efflux RND transporter periplasmic adaptor subunit [Polyangiaceae bacterium]